MTLISFFTSLINIGEGWLTSAMYTVCLFFEGIVFEGVTLLYNLFLLVCSLNLTTITGLMAPLVDRLKALIIVFIVFKLGVSLVSYLVEPKKAQEGGTKIIVNIFITALLLISYSTIFDIFNELNLLIFGNPMKYPYTVLSTVADVTPEDNDKGLIMRFVFGNGAEELDDVGEFLAYSTLTMFIYDYGHPNSNNNVSAVVCPSYLDSCDFKRLPNAEPKIGTLIEYHPVFAFAVGLYLVYSLGKSTIAVGVRMFKLVVMQLIAPVAIVTILDGGLKADVFQKFYKKYIEVYLSAILRLLATLVITVLICKFLQNIGDIINATFDKGSWNNLLVAIVIIWAGFKFMNEAPAFIESLLGAKLGDGNDKSSFGQFLGGILGGAIGGVVGMSTGLVTGVAGGSGLGRLTGGLGNMLAGGFSGMAAGAKGKSVADKFKNIGGNVKSNSERAARMGMIGGGLTYGLSKLETPIADLEQRQLDRATSRKTYYEDVLSARKAAIAETKSDYLDAKGDKIKYDENFVDKALAADTEVTKAKAAYDSISGLTDAERQERANALNEQFSTFSADRQNDIKRRMGLSESDPLEFNKDNIYQFYASEYQRTSEERKKHYEEELEYQMFNHEDANNNKAVQEADRQYDRYAEKGRKVKDIAKHDIHGENSVKSFNKKQKLANAEAVSKATNRHALRVKNRVRENKGK